MQYKIPISIENEDTIILGLSLRQLSIIIVGLIIVFGIFNKLEGLIPNTPLIIICIVILGIFVIVAKFRTHEMTMLPFILHILRYKINGSGPNRTGRLWLRGVDSYSPLEMGYVQSDTWVQSTKKRTKDTADLAKHLQKL